LAVTEAAGDLNRLSPRSALVEEAIRMTETPTDSRRIKAIDTRYRGHLFRSRLEARWAVFFDWMGVIWEYEKEGYTVNGIPYLPDFWLPEHSVFIEIKGLPPTIKESNLTAALCEVVNCATAIFHGLPGENYGELFCWDLNDSTGGRGNFEAAISAKDDGGFCFQSFNTRDREYFSDELFERLLAVRVGDNSKDPRLQRAFQRASTARFEHGDNPAPGWLR
jgi:hypothetical protein